MTNPKKKNTKRPLPLRNSGEDAGPLERPSKTLFDAVLRAEEKEQAEAISPKVSLPRQTSVTSVTSLSSQSVAPMRDFQKVPNSITKTAIPDGLFKPGKSKHLYDVLYGITRGAIEAKRTVRISKTNLRKLAGIGSRVTFDSCVVHLEAVGLIRLTVRIGEHEGNEFEVLTPDEISLPRQTRHTSHTSVSNSVQKLDTLVSLETRQTSQSPESINTGVSDAPKTLLKTNTNDDEAFAAFLAKFSEVSHKLTGKGLNKSERESWAKLADVLIAELLSAAARAKNPVSSVPAFLTEILRRQFFAARLESQQSTPKASKTKPDTVGKNETGEYEIKVLDEKGREAALAELGEFAGESFLEDFKKWYTAEDWQWLTENLKGKTE